MLYNHKLRLKQSDYIATIDYTRPSFSPDGKAFSCLVSPKYDINNNDILLLDINNGGSLRVRANVENIIEQGWVELDTVFELFDSKTQFPPYEDENTPIDGAENTEWRYFLNQSGIIESGYINSEGKLYFPLLDLTVTEYNKDVYPNTITIPYRYYIENDILTYNGLKYVMNYDSEGNIAPIQDLGNHPIFIHDRDKKKWKEWKRVSISLPMSVPIDFDEVLLGKVEWYVTVDDWDYVLSERPTKIDGHTFFVKYLPNDDALKPKSGSSGYVEDYIPTFYDMDENIDASSPYIESSITLWDGIKRVAKPRIVPSDGGNMLIMSVNTDSFANVYNSSSITAERVKSTNTPYYLNEDGESVTIDDVDYPVTTVEMVDFDGLREVYKEGDNDMYFVKIGTGRKIYFKKEDDKKYTLLFDNTIKYEITKQNKLQYNGKEYFKNIDDKDNPDKKDVPEDEQIDYAFIIPSKPGFNLKVMEIREPNTYYCKLTDDTTNSYSGFRDGKKEWIYKDIVANVGMYVFSLEPQTFFPDLTDISNQRHLFEGIDLPVVINTPSILLRKHIAEMAVPVHLVTLHGTNLNQEIDVAAYIDEQKTNAINRIVDMEKDMYFPMVIKGRDEETKQAILDDALEINFFLHLRTRNDDWTVRDDKLIEVENMFGKKFIDEINEEVTEGKMEEDDINEKYYKTSWNIMDYYMKEDDSFVRTGTTADNGFKLTGDEIYYQPSDLLGFFDFSDDDIFYQKTKVGKTFLRLSFYDTKDPQTQSLLGTSTVFFDSRGFFGKFTDKMSNPDEDIRYASPMTWKGTSTAISCNREAVTKLPTGNQPREFLDDELRMSSTVSITNKIATDKSAEGFYNYIFREYSEKLHERRIYLRVQLNHAGHGEVIDLFQPMVKQDDGTMRLAKFNEIDKAGFNYNEVYNMMFIPVNVKYDEEHNKYCWYLPEELVPDDLIEKENKIKFNLYEIKIRKT